MTFDVFISIAVNFIQGVTCAVTLYQVFKERDHKKEIKDKEWEAYKKRFKHYIENHPELDITIIAPIRKGYATSYQFVGLIRREGESK